MIGYLGHFLLDFLGQIRTQGTLRHVLGPIFIIFEIFYFLMIPELFEYFSEITFYSETDGPHLDIRI